jgi:hypothetical protein
VVAVPSAREYGGPSHQEEIPNTWLLLLLLFFHYGTPTWAIYPKQWEEHGRMRTELLSKQQMRPLMLFQPDPSVPHHYLVLWIWKLRIAQRTVSQPLLVTRLGHPHKSHCLREQVAAIPK